ncbi:MAG TPA: sulfatase-like hydrolase/transferase [Sulfuriferula sp.]|nr:sulfatase-like hydrolase/transferase [Sulfuriferula sp.]
MTSVVRLAVVICTHNRAHSLTATLDSLYACGYAGTEAVDILVVANHCHDDTLATLAAFRSCHYQSLLRLRWIEEPVAGKSHALNAAIASTDNDYLCFIDDDQVVETGFLQHLLDGLDAYQDDAIFCGRIWPAWDGSEPAWVHAQEPYAIPIRPFPEFDLGQDSITIAPNQRFPSGGNITVHRRVFTQIGNFAVELGPTGHNLAGGEDHDFIGRATAHGHTIRYLPKVRQLHAIDAQRTSTLYTLRKSFFRSRSHFLIHAEDSQPRPYMVRKILSHLGKAVFTFNPDRRFFYLSRFSASAGELAGALEQHSPVTLAQSIRPAAWLTLGGFGLLTVFFSLTRLTPQLQKQVAQGVTMAVVTAVVIALLIGAKSLRDFSQTGPQIQTEIRSYYRWYTLAAFIRLLAWALLLLILMGAFGAVVYAALAAATGLVYTPVGAFIAAFLGVALITSWQFCRQLLYLPASLVSSMHYRMSRLYPLWRGLNPARLHFFGWALGALALALFGFASLRLIELDEVAPLAALWGSMATLIGLVGWANAAIEPASVVSQRTDPHPNILMLGSDTLRADRLGVAGYHRQLTPNLDKLGVNGCQFTQCYVPCARTAPSLISLFSGTWPHRHGIRDNFVADDETRLNVPCLPALLAEAGYTTIAVSDWCGADLGKFSLGFQQVDAPDDQWNIKYLIRQGPKDLRLFLSLFTHNRFGKRFLPELYYLAGVPLTTQVGRDARAQLSRLAEADQPFLLNVFLSATHPPFGSEYPYYARFSDPTYAGESKFVMARLTDPQEIIRRQGDGRKEFDLDQILDLYDGCVKSFDDEAGRILDHLAACGLADNTIVVVYSDHGMEFFEHETWGQGNSAVGDFSARIPLIIHDPRTPGSGVQQQIVRSVDIAPTLLELAGLTVPETMEGVSLAGLVQGETHDLELSAFNETGIWITDLPGMPEDHLRYPNLLELLEVPNKASGTLAIKSKYRDIVFKAKDRMIRVGRWKLVYQPVEDGALYKLFDLESDPACQHNRLADEPGLAELLKQKLLAWVADDSTCGNCCSHMETLGNSADQA